VYAAAMWPTRLIAAAYVARGARLWLATRLVVTVVLLFGQEEPIKFSPMAFAGMIVLSTAACFLDVRRRREAALLGNLGVSRLSLAPLFIGPAVLGESLIYLAASSR
jgi:hypothetical protein